MSYPDRHSPLDATSTAKVLGLALARGTLEQAVERIVASALEGAKRRYAFVNAHCYNVMWRSTSYREALNSADSLFPDGTGVRWAARLVGERADNLNGTDMFPLLCRAARDAGLSIFLLGAQPGVAERVAHTAERLAPGIRIAGTHHGYFDAGSVEETAAIERVNASGADILLVAMGVPRQDRWLARHHDSLNVRASLGVGGLFDFYSGRIPRAPKWLRQLGGEWVFRLYQEPIRLFRRYVLGNPAFLATALLLALSHHSRRAIDSDGTKRALDVALSAGALLVLSPLLAIIALAIRAGSKGPVLFRQTRMGAHGEPFQMLKFRSMYVDAEARHAALLARNERGDLRSFKMSDDPRVTAVGHMLRRTSLDELPQLFNILAGDMAVVGPRPAIPREVSYYDRRALGRLTGKPGLTCTWQVSGRALIGFEQQVEMDLDYLRRRSLRLDISILLRTVPAVISGRGAM